MLIKTQGIVFRQIKYGETSLIVDIYTRNLGMQRYMVHGVRSRSAKTKANLYQVLTQLDLDVYHRQDRDLQRVRDCRLGFVYQQLPFDVRRGAVGMFIAEVARKTIRGSEENPALYEFLTQTLIHLDRSTHSIANTHLHFLIAFSGFLGFLPEEPLDGDRSFFDLQEGIYQREAPPHGYFLGPELSSLFARLQVSGLSDCHEVGMSRDARHRLLDKLIMFYRLHIDHLPDIHAHRILRTVF